MKIVLMCFMLVAAVPDSDGHSGFNDHFALAISTLQHHLTQQGKYEVHEVEKWDNKTA